MQIQFYGSTDRGRSRERNEDAYFIHAERRVFAVADGLGGLPGGDVASSMAVEAIEQILEGQNGAQGLKMPELMRHTNRQIIDRGRELSPEVGIGTTLTMLEIRDWRARIGHIGDTVCFKLRGGILRQVTVDHTMEQEIKDRLRPGEEAYIPDYFAHTLTRCLGQDMGGEPDVFDEPLSPGDRLLLASDGITKVFEDPEIARIMSENESPEPLVQHLIDEGNARGGPDNITAIAIFLPS